jgi:hypothetical protein
MKKFALAALLGLLSLAAVADAAPRVVAVRQPRVVQVRRAPVLAVRVRRAPVAAVVINQAPVFAVVERQVVRGGRVVTVRETVRVR